MQTASLIYICNINEGVVVNGDFAAYRLHYILVIKLLLLPAVAYNESVCVCAAGDLNYRNSVYKISGTQQPSVELKYSNCSFPL